MARTRILRPVLLVHGIASRGDWQDRFLEDLKLFFEPVQVRYKHFRGPFGALLVVCEPWILAFAILLGLALAIWLIPKWDAIAIASAIALLAVLPLGVEYRRKAALQVYLQAAGAFLHRRPHVIAHSFGTYLTARLVESINGLQFSRVVLCGCVLPQSYNWAVHIGQKSVLEVRNDFTRADWVGLAAKLAGRLHSNLGNAGTHGMSSALKHVHRLEAPNRVCVNCVPTAGLIHDVDCSHLGHSQSLLVESHLRSWWIPFLWGLDAAEHDELIQLCGSWVKARNSHDWEGIARLEGNLEATKWTWCHGQTVRTHLERALHDHGKAHDLASVLLAFDQLALLIHAASASDLCTREALFLEPDFAVNAAALGSR